MTAIPMDELNVMVIGQGGDGSLTLANLIGDVLGRRGYHLYFAREVDSRIKGGRTCGHLRASIQQRGCLGDRVDLVVVFGHELSEASEWLHEGSYVLHDASDAPLTGVGCGATVLELPVGRDAVRGMRREVYKTGIAFGVISRLIGMPDPEAEITLRRRLERMPTEMVEDNVEALRWGFAHADASGLPRDGGPWRLAAPHPNGRLLMNGNEGLASGFIAAGGRFYAGYPITPATEILELMTRWLPEFGGAAVQAEDELSAINMALGAALTGARAMTASSGPGISLMQETVGQLGSAEIGLVVVDCQRAGPSTGMPTRPEQSDVGMLVHGGNGDFGRVVLAPSDPGEAFELGVLAANLADRMQGPVYLALDQVVSQNAMTLDRPDLGAVRIDHGKRLTEADLATCGEYRRYALTADGISPWAPVGTFGGQHLSTGNERDEWGRVNAKADNRARMTDKRARKLDAVRDLLPRARVGGVPAAPVGLIGFGMEAGVMAEAAEQLGAGGLPVRTLQPRTLWPVLEDVFEFASACRSAYVVEHNASAQYRGVLAGAGVPSGRLRSVLRYDGVPFRPAELAARVREAEEA